MKTLTRSDLMAMQTAGEEELAANIWSGSTKEAADAAKTGAFIASKKAYNASSRAHDVNTPDAHKEAAQAHDVARQENKEAAKKQMPKSKQRISLLKNSDLHKQIAESHMEKTVK